jgi:hypothetical protein
MSQTIDDKNKTPVPEAFDVLFNKRDYTSVAPSLHLSKAKFFGSSTASPVVQGASVEQPGPARRVVLGGSAQRASGHVAWGLILLVHISCAANDLTREPTNPVVNRTRPVVFAWALRCYR